MLTIKNNKMQKICLALYLFFLSFLNFTPFYIVAVVGLAGFTLLKIIRTGYLRVTSYVIFGFVFILYIVLHTLLGLSTDAGASMEAVMTLCFNCAISVCVVNSLENEIDIQKTLRWIVYIAVFSNLYAIIYYLSLGYSGRLMHGVERPFGGSDYTAMEFTSWALYAGTFALFEYLQTGDRKILIPFPLFWTVIIWGGSRKWILFGALLQVAVYLLCGKKENLTKKLKKRLLIIGVLIIGVYLILENSFLYDKVGERFIGFITGEDSSARTRDYLAELAIEYIKQRPILGYGIATFKNVNIYNNWTESNYLELAFGGGVPLALLYYGYLIFLFGALFRIRNRDKIYMLFSMIILMIIISDMVSMSYLQRTESFLITLGSLLLAYQKRTGKYRMQRSA